MRVLDYKFVEAQSNLMQEIFSLVNFWAGYSLEAGAWTRVAMCSTEPCMCLQVVPMRTLVKECKLLGSEPGNFMLLAVEAGWPWLHNAGIDASGLYAKCEVQSHTRPHSATVCVPKMPR